MFRFYCIRQVLYVGVFFFLYQSVSFAQQTSSTYLSCLGEANFASCVEEGPLSARLVGDIRRALDEAEAKIAAGGDDGHWALYSLRFAERDFIERVRQTFDLANRPAERLPVVVKQAVNELALRMAALTGGTPNSALDGVWSAATRDALAARLQAKSNEVVAAVPEDESAVIGKRFVVVFARAPDPAPALAEAPPMPVSPAQYTRIGLYQLQATECLIENRDTARAAELHEELVAWSHELQALGETVSPDVPALQAHLLNGMLEAGA